MVSSTIGTDTRPSASAFTTAVTARWRRITCDTVRSVILSSTLLHEFSSRFFYLNADNMSDCSRGPRNRVINYSMYISTTGQRAFAHNRRQNFEVIIIATHNDKEQMTRSCAQRFKSIASVRIFYRDTKKNIYGKQFILYAHTHFYFELQVSINSMKS